MARLPIANYILVKCIWTYISSSCNIENSEFRILTLIEQTISFIKLTVNYILTISDQVLFQDPAKV